MSSNTEKEDFIMITDAIEARYEVEVHRLQDTLKQLEPGTEQYEAVHVELLKAMEVMNETTKIEDARQGAKTDMVVKVTTFAAGLVLTPVITTLCQRSLAKFIGTVEQMETFTSTAGRSMSSWFRWKN